MGRGGLAALKVAVAVMSVLIVAGVAVLVVTMTRRLAGTSAGSVSVALEEPWGTTIASMAVAGDRLVLSLHGGGPDRVAVVDLHGGAVARVAVSR